VTLAEALGYTRAWLYDSSALYFDPWITLARAAERTTEIGLAVGVAVPALRHVTVTASALLTAHDLAPGRLALGLGAGGTGTLMLGKKSWSWRSVVAYTDALRGLLRGEMIDWDGSEVQLAHRGVSSPPVDPQIPILFAAEGPRGEQAAREHADGILTVFHNPVNSFDWCCRVIFGTVLDDGEAPTSDRAFAAAGSGAAPVYHFAYTTGNKSLLEHLPGGSDWGAAVDKLPARGKHLSIWRGHCVELNELDSALIPRQAVAAMTVTGTPAAVRGRVDQLKASASEIIYQPAGPDIPRELREFAAATLSSTAG
jgi:5,10-methylenetetrahydromethanopterin reductase